MLIIIIIFIIIIKVNYKKASKRASKKAAKVDMKNWNKYYRELPGNYSPAIVSVLCDFEQELYKDLPAIILNLCANGYIDIIEKNGEYVYIDKNKELSSLMENERYVLDYILHKTDKPFDNEEWSDIIINDTKKLELIEEIDIKKRQRRDDLIVIKKILKPFAIMFAFIMIITTIGIIEIKNLNYIADKLDKYNLATQEEILELEESYQKIGNINIREVYLTAVEIFLFISFIFGIPIFVIEGIVDIMPKIRQLNTNKYKYIRTKKGEENYKNWIAFKNFLEDYSYIEQRNMQDVYLWQYYLAYATALGIADKVLSTSNKKILQNEAFNITNYSSFIESIDKSKKNF